MDIHVKLHKTEIYKKSVINIDTKVYHNLPGFIKEIKDYKAFKKELQKIIRPLRKNYNYFFFFFTLSIQWKNLYYSSICTCTKYN